MTATLNAGLLKPCCADPANRRPGLGPRGGDAPDGMTVTHCVVCGCRHFEIDADPVELGVEGARL